MCLFLQVPQAIDSLVYFDKHQWVSLVVLTMGAKHQQTFLPCHALGMKMLDVKCHRGQKNPIY